jgi:hypothetical protein
MKNNRNAYSLKIYDFLNFNGNAKFLRYCDFGFAKESAKTVTKGKKIAPFSLSNN